MTELPDGWRRTTLGEECEIVSGSTPKTSEPAFWDGEIPWLTPADLSKWKGTYIDGGARSLTQAGLDSCSARLFPKNTVMMSSRAPIGYTAIANRQMCTNQGFKSMLPSPSVNPEWLRYFLEHALPEIKAMSSGTTFAEISGKKLGTLPMNLPNVEQQTRIVEALDDHLSRLDKALADLEAAAQLSQHLFLASLEKAIEECEETSYEPLAHCLNLVDQKKKVQRGWSPQCLSHPQSDSSKWAVLKTTAVQNMRYEPQHNKELPKKLEPKTHLEVQIGDFLMTTTGPRNRCGVVCLVTSTPKRLIFSGKILRFQPDPSKLLPAWLELVLASHRYQKQLDRLKVGSSDSSVSIGNAQVLELAVPVPSIAAQRRLVGNIQKMKTLAERFERNIEHEAQKFKELRRVLLQAAFSGNLGSK